MQQQQEQQRQQQHRSRFKGTRPAAVSRPQTQSNATLPIDSGILQRDAISPASLSTLHPHSSGATLSPPPPAPPPPAPAPHAAYLPTTEDLRRVFAALYDLRGSTEWTDVTVVLGDPPRAFHAHRALLASCSPQLRELLRRSPAQVHIVGISADAFAAILEFLYGRPLVLEMATVESVLVAAQRLGLANVRQQCSEFLVQNLDENNCRQMHVLAASHRLQSLNICCLELIRRQEGRVATSENVSRAEVLQQVAREVQPPAVTLPSQEERNNGNNMPRASDVVEQWARHLQKLDSATHGGV